MYWLYAEMSLVKTSYIIAFLLYNHFYEKWLLYALNIIIMKRRLPESNSQRRREEIILVATSDCDLYGLYDRRLARDL